MEGRDIGSVIFPDADFRFFLHAESAERERRREKEGRVDRVTERDRIDSSRKTAPFSRPAGAISIDTTLLTIAEVADRMAAFIAPKFAP
jgi:cytidylate kinase